MNDYVYYMLKTVTCPTCKGDGRIANKAWVANMLKSYRHQRDIGLRELARKAGWCPAFVCKIERGECLPTNETICRFKEACDAIVTKEV